MVDKVKEGGFVIENEFIKLHNLISKNSFVSYETDIGNVLSILNYLKDESFILVDIFAVDYPNNQKRISLIYILLSMKLNKRAQVSIMLDPVSDFPTSVCEIFKSANWFEREVFDMYGVQFTNHPQLERILTDYNFEGHPMLKDFPLTGYKEVRYDMESKEVVYDEVDLSQEYRSFDLLTHWEGTKYVDEIMGKKNDN